MIGLKYIREHCHMTPAMLGEKIGVTRQAICLWENRQKDIPDKRAEEIAKIFGVDKALIYEISEEKMKELNQRAMYHNYYEDYYSYSKAESSFDYKIHFSSNENIFAELGEVCKETKEYLQQLSEIYIKFTEIVRASKRSPMHEIIQEVLTGLEFVLGLEEYCGPTVGENRIYEPWDEWSEEFKKIIIEHAKKRAQEKYTEWSHDSAREARFTDKMRQDYISSKTKWNLEQLNIRTREPKDDTLLNPKSLNKI